MLNKSEQRAQLNIRKDLLQDPKPIREIDDIEIEKEDKKDLMKIYKESKEWENLQDISNRQLFSNRDESQFKTQQFNQKSKDLFSALDNANSELKEKYAQVQQKNGESLMFQQDQEQLKEENQKIREYYQNENDRKLISYNNAQFTQYSLKDVDYDEKNTVSDAFAFLKDLEKRQKKQEKKQQNKDKMIDEDNEEEQVIQQENQNDMDKLEEEIDSISFKPKYNKNVIKNRMKNEDHKQSQQQRLDLKKLKKQTQMLSIADDDDEDEEEDE